MSLYNNYSNFKKGIYMTLFQELIFLQTNISSLIEQSGISYKSINLSLRSTKPGFDLFSMSWSYSLSENAIKNNNKITQDELTKDLYRCILNTGLKPFHYSLTIQVETINSFDLMKWKIRTINRNYLKTYKKINGVVCEIQFISMRQ